MKYIYIPYDQHKTSTSTPFVSSLVQIGDFSVTTNLDSSKTTNTYNVFQNIISYTLDDIAFLSGTTSPSTQALKNVTLQVNQKKITSFLKYGSVERNVLQALDYIYYNFPATLLIEDNVLGKQGFNILNVSYNPITDKSSFVINSNFVFNPLDINYLSVDLPNREKFAVHRNLKDSFSDYFFEVNGVQYPITNYEGSTKLNNAFLSVEVKGRPFDNGNHSQLCYITPSTQLKNTYKQNAPLFVSILSRNERSDGYYLVFDDTVITGQNYLLEYELTIIFPKTDKYNVDFSTSRFDTFKDEMLKYAKKQDDKNTNLVLRKYVSPDLMLPVFDSLESVENQGDKLDVLLSTFAFGFDEQYKFINALKNINILTYNGEDNMPVEIVDVFLSSHGFNIDTKLSTQKKRELGLVLTWLVKSKGTKAAVEFIFNYLNIPLDLVNFKQYVRKVDQPLNIELLQKYLTIIYGTPDFSNLSVDEDGYPKYREDFIFEDSNYWSQFYILDENLNGKYKSLVNQIITQTSIYEKTFESTGTTFEYEILSSSCYVTQSGIVDDVLKTPVYDECGCLIETEDKALQIALDPIDLYSGCTKPILDVWQECVGYELVKLHINAYGGKPPYTISGATDGLILPSNIPFSTLAIDSIGCQSLITTGTTLCYNPICENNPILVNLDYLCLTDDNGVPTNNASVIVAVSGGTPPYIIHGSLNGDILPNGDIIATEVIDALGCTSGIITKTIDCPVPNPCDPLDFSSTGECTANRIKTAVNLNVTYNLDNVPSGVDVNTVVMTITKGASGGTLLGDPVTEVFQSQNGAKKLTVNFGSAVGVMVLNVDVVITLTNGCRYTDTYSLTVDCTLLGNNSVDTYNNILTA